MGTPNFKAVFQHSRCGGAFWRGEVPIPALPKGRQKKIDSESDDDLETAFGVVWLGWWSDGGLVFLGGR